MDKRWSAAFVRERSRCAALVSTIVCSDLWQKFVLYRKYTYLPVNYIDSGTKPVNMAWWSTLLSYIAVDPRQCDAKYFNLIAKVFVINCISVGLNVEDTAGTWYWG